VNTLRVRLRRQERITRFFTDRYNERVEIAAGSSGVMNGVLLASAVVPVLIVLAGAWWFLRAGRRHDERERAGGEDARAAPARTADSDRSDALG